VFEATLSEDLISILEKPAQIAAADNRLRAAAADALTTVLDVVAEAQSTFASAQGADREIHSAEEHAAVLHRLLDIAELRRKVGDAGAWRSPPSPPRSSKPTSTSPTSASTARNYASPSPA